MKFKRSGGILLHPTSLPGKFGIGDLGPNAYRWVDFLSDTKSKLWQILPLGQTGYGDSPYQCFSAFAGNTYLISPELLYEIDLLGKEDIKRTPTFTSDHVDFGSVIPWKKQLLTKAAVKFLEDNNHKLVTEYARFTSDESFWLDDYALFLVLKGKFQGNSWLDWPLTIRKRDRNFISHFVKENKTEIEIHKFLQFVFFFQWKNLKSYANSRGVEIIGDTPIFIAMDSADVWTNPELFCLNEKLQPEVVAGVPPDYFSSTGQLWGNPLYRWPAHSETRYAWWIKRLKSTLRQCDYIRLDHFRGFAGYWEVPSHLPTAEIGRWLPGPGTDFFDAVLTHIPELPIIAEDLGVITEDVTALKEHYQFPGMKVLQFAFDRNSSNPFLPHNFTTNCVAYTGTHDNDTTLGWYESLSEDDRTYVNKFIGLGGVPRSKLTYKFIREIWRSVAVFSVAPMQDFLCLGQKARMNFPGKPDGNWTWRMSESDLDNAGVKNLLTEINTLYNR